MLFALLGSTVIATYSISKISREYTSERLSALSTDVERSINDVISQTVSVSRTIANDTFLTSLLERENETNQQEISDLLASYTDKLENIFSYEWVFIASEQTKAYYSSSGIYQILDVDSDEASWYTDFVNLNKEYDVSVGTDNDAPDTATFFVDVRIENEEGDFLGICGVAVKMDDLKAVISEYEDEYNVSVFFVDENKEMQLSGEETDFEDIDLDEGQSEQILVNRMGLEADYTIVKYIDQLGWHMIIKGYDPFNQTVDLFLIIFTTFSSVLVLIIAVLCLSYIVKRNQALFTSSYKDDMTGLYNRRAYDDKRKELRKMDSIKKYTVIVFDINGLKAANDNLGHFAGDELIRGASKIIQDVFGEQGQCFRIGGDEFVAILEGESINLKYLKESFDARVSEWSGEYVNSLTVSYGAVSGADNPDWTIDELTALADEKMYWQKKNYYKKSGRDRRRA
jgi:diguanylate cyclase (GGDEF)-like protein